MLAGPGVTARATQAAVIVLEAQTGAVRAMVGGRAYAESAFNRANQARRQPGSAFKPLVYAAAFEKGVTPEDIVKDAPVTFDGYAPSNADGGFLGNISITQAIVRSVNTAAVRIANQVGPDKISSLARRFGVTGLPDHPALPIALGAYEVSLIDLTGAYQVFQTGGRQTTPFLVQQVSNARGDLLWRRNPGLPTPIYDDHRAGQMVSILRQVIESPAGTGRHARLDRPAAGKTGTSQNYRDAWFIGFTPDFVCGVWVGDDHGRPMRGVSGGETPALIWRDFMLAAHRGLAPREFPNSPGADPRAPYYRSLSRDFEAAMRPDPPGGDPKPVEVTPSPGAGP
jgi:penicillin-binding protein 1A